MAGREERRGTSPATGLMTKKPLSRRSLPMRVVEWLDKVYPPADAAQWAGGGEDGSGLGWLTRATSAITRPQQSNGFDCGVFMTSHAEAAGVVDRPFEIQQSQMVEMRQCMVWELINKRLHR